MIKGLSGLDLNALASAFARSKQAQPPSRNITPVPRMDTVQFSAQGQRLAASGGAANDAPRNENATVYRPVRPDNIARPAEAGVPAHARPASAPDNRPAEPAGMLDRMRAAFLVKEGDPRFDAALDLNADGRIDFKDVGILREQQRPVGPEAMLKRMQESFLLRKGDEGFNAAVDLNRDGMINFKDLGILRAKMDGVASQTRPPEPAAPAAVQPESVTVTSAPVSGTRDDPEPGQLLKSIRSAFLSTEGDSSFNTAADLNSDGRIDFFDLAELKAR